MSCSLKHDDSLCQPILPTLLLTSPTSCYSLPELMKNWRRIRPTASPSSVNNKQTLIATLPQKRLTSTDSCLKYILYLSMRVHIGSILGVLIINRFQVHHGTFSDVISCSLLELHEKRRIVVPA